MNIKRRRKIISCDGRGNKQKKENTEYRRQKREEKGLFNKIFGCINIQINVENDQAKNL